MKDFGQQKATINDVRFEFEKIPALPAWRLFEDIRHALGTVDVGEIKLTSAGDAMGHFIKTFMALPPDFVESVRLRLFQHISFSSMKDDGSGYQPMIKLSSAEDMAFQKLEPYHIYELIARSLAVNFTESFNAALLAFPIKLALADTEPSKP